jgi:hypothetical protein
LANNFFSASRYFSLDILHRGIYVPLSRKNSVRRKMMFTFADYTKAMEKFVSATPFEVAENMKPFVEYQAKLSQVAFDAAKKNVEIGQAWVNETIEALDTFAKPAEKPADVAAASTEFAKAQVEAAPKHIASFADVAKKAQVETAEIMLNAGKDVQNNIVNA